MAVARAVQFGDLLRRYRVAAGLTQEELAERAGLSAKGISDLERGARTSPRRDTVNLLADALGLGERDRNVLAAAARQRSSLPAAVPSAGMRSGSSPSVLPLVGRVRECAVLERQLSGEGAALLAFAGEPGVGKSRLLREAAERATERGWAVLAGGCHRRSGQEPFAPFTDIIAHSLAAFSPADRRARLHGCTRLAHLLPEIADLTAGAAPPAAALSPEQERRLTFAAVARYLANVAGPAGTVLVLDDLQWAGTDALDLLASIVRAEASCTLRVIVAYRDTEVRSHLPLGVLLADLAREGFAERVLLTPLPREDAARLLDELLPQADAHLRRGLLQRTGGLPFFLVSCAQGLSSGALTASQQGDIPWSVAETIRQRVAALPESAQTILHVAAIAGREVRRSLLLHVATQAGQPEDIVLAGLDAACEARLIEEEGEGGYQFAHDLVREVVAGDLTAAQRARLHRQVAEALEQELGATPVEELAYHYSRAGLAEKAASYLERAGDQARAMCANAEAAEYYRELAERLDELGRTLEGARAREREGEALVDQARFGRALAALERAAQVYQAHGDLDGQARVTTAIGRLQVNRGAPQEAVKLLGELAQALDAAGRTGPSALSLHVGYARALIACGRFSEAAAAAGEAARAARAGADSSLLGRAEAAHGLALAFLGSAQESGTLLDRAILALEQAIRVLQSCGDLRYLSLALNDLATLHSDRGEFAQAAAYQEHALEVSLQFGDPTLTAFLIGYRAQWWFDTGDWRRADAELERAATLLREVGHSWASPYIAYFLGRLRQAQGGRAGGVGYLEEAIRLGEQSGALSVPRMARRALAECDLLDGRGADAIAHLGLAARSPDQEEPDATKRRLLLAWAYLVLGDDAQARREAQEAVVLAGAQRLGPTLADALRVQALVAIGQSQWREAEDSLDRALDVSRGVASPYAEAKALYVYGLLEAKRNVSQRARERLGAALTILGRLGERLYAKLIEEALASLEP